MGPSWIDFKQEIAVKYQRYGETLMAFFPKTNMST